MLSIIYFVCLPAGAADNLLKNGAMDGDADPLRPLAAWTAYLWEGTGEVVRYAPGANAAAALIRNDGPGKQAIFQRVTLQPCTYKLSFEVASSELIPNDYMTGATVHISGRSPGALTLELIRSGTHDWQQQVATFSVPAVDSTLIYFFNYGTGAFFVRNVQLTRAETCGNDPAVLSSATPTREKLVYSPPIGPEGDLLAGYCSQPAFQSRAVCRRLSENSPTRERTMAKTLPPLILGDFEAQSPFSGYDVVTGTNALGGARSAKLLRGRYMDAGRAQGLPSDWRGYDWLKLDALNRSAAPQPVYIEINDEKTTGYWSRVNWTTSVAPGRSTVFVPLNVYVGEKSVIRERRRLDLATITKLVITSLHADLIVDNIRLEVEPTLAHDFPELIKLDVGPSTSPVFPSFTALHPGMPYKPELGYGFAPGTQFGRAEDRRHPGSLFNDWVSLKTGGIDIDLPNGQYQLWMMLEDPGYWEYYPSFLQREVMAQGKVILEERRSVEEFWSRFYRHADDEDLPGDDVWERYVRKRYVPFTAAVRIDNGQLNLRFNSHGDPHGATLSALIVFPLDQASEGAAFLSDLWDRLKTEFERLHVQVRPVQAELAASSEKDIGLTLDGELQILTQSPVEAVEHKLVVERPLVTDTISVTVPRGFAQPVAIGLDARKELRITNLKLDVPGVRASMFSIRRKMVRMTEDGSVYASLPQVLDPIETSPERPLILRGGATRWLWLDFEAAYTSQSGKTPGRLEFTLDDGRTFKIIIDATIARWGLPEADIPFGYLGSTPTYPATTYPAVGAKRYKEFAASISVLKSLGMTVITGGLGGPILKGYAHGSPAIDVRNVDRTMAVLVTDFGGTVLSYLGLEPMGLSMRSVENTTQQYGKPYADVLRDFLTALDNASKQHNWRPINFTIGDEPSDEDVENVLGVATAFRQAKPSARTNVFTSLINVDTDPRRAFAGAVTDIYLTGHSLAAINLVKASGSACHLYNQSGRFRRGIYLFKLHKVGCDGNMQFAYHSAHADQWYDLDGRESDKVAVFTHRDGRLRLSADAMLYREAITDYRHLMLLERLVKLNLAHPIARGAQAWLDDLEAKIKVGSVVNGVWPNSELDSIRAAAARFIDALAS
jgi:hypothetical protein